jgi:hypothetical protein
MERTTSMLSTWPRNSMVTAICTTIASTTSAEASSKEKRTRPSFTIKST